MLRLLIIPTMLLSGCVSVNSADAICDGTRQARADHAAALARLFWVPDGATAISAKVADAAGQKARYIHNRGLDDQHYQQLVVGYLRKYKQAKRTDFDELLTSKLAAVLTPEQKASAKKLRDRKSVV